MELVVPVQEFYFDSAATTPYTSAPSSPKHFGLDPFEFYNQYTSAQSSPAARGEATTIVDNDFAFDFTWQLEKSAPPPPLTSADELFEEGKIRPLKPPPRLCSPQGASAAPASEATIISGRNRTPSSAYSTTISPSRSRKGSRSLSPLRAGKGSHFQTPSSSHEGSRKWRIMDFLLFRSASEGRATGDRSKDPLRKFTALNYSSSSSFRSVESNGSAGRGNMRNSMSPHAMHYTANRAAAEEMKKKTALPYQQSFFSCLRFSPALHSLTRRDFPDHFSNRGRP